MSINHSNPSRDRKRIDSTLSRRRFLLGAATLTGASALWADELSRADTTTQVLSPVRPRVVQLRDSRTVTPLGIRQDLLFDLLEALLKRLTNQSNTTDAWRSILRHDDVIGLKFNRTGADALGTAEPMFAALVRSLQQAGFRPDQIVAVDVSSHAVKQAGVRSAPWGWSKAQFDFGSGRDRLAVWLEEVTAIVNVPFLTTHNICKLGGCLTNLAYDVVKHPAQFYGKEGSPYVADIVALPGVHDKLKLNLLNALRVVFDQGPLVQEDFVTDAGLLLGGIDPVATDTVALYWMDQLRSRLRLSGISDTSGSLSYLKVAGELGLGKAKLHEIDLRKVAL